MSRYATLYIVTKLALHGSFGRRRKVVGIPRAFVVAAALCALFGLGACTGASRGGSVPSTSLTAPELGEAGEGVTMLGPGTYIAGQQLSSGLYEVTMNAGVSAFVRIDRRESDPLGSTMEILVTPEAVGQQSGLVPTIRVDIVDGDEITLQAGPRGEFTLDFTPVTSRRIEPIDGQVILHAGRWFVGDDLAPGRYVAEVGPGKRGSLVVSDGRVDVNLEHALLDGDGADGGQTTVALDLAVGDRIRISGLDKVTLSPV